MPTSRSRFRSARLGAKVCCAAILAAASLIAQESRAEGLIAFDDFAFDTAVQYQYLAQGVQFDGLPGAQGTGARISTGQVAAHSGANVLINSSTDAELTGGPLTGTLPTPQRTVDLWAGYAMGNGDPGTREGTLRGFDASGNLIAIAGPLTVTGGETSTEFRLESANADIVSFTLDVGAFVYTVIDDLEVTGGTPVTPPAGPPVVQLFDPANGSVLDASFGSLLILGGVGGDDLMPTVTVELRLLTPSPSPTTPVVQSVNMFLAPGLQLFSGARFPNLLIGNYSLTVTATNRAGQTGSVTVGFSVFPESLRDRAAGFQFAVTSAHCQIAVFDDVSFALFPSASPIEIPKGISDKWFEVKDQVKNYAILRNDGTLGCPVEESYPHDIPNEPGLRFQEFERGRIYVNVYPGSDYEPAYTPKVFADAIRTLSTFSDPDVPLDGTGIPPRVLNNLPLGEREVGIPIADPKIDLFGDDPTWLFQRFARRGYDGPANTLEVRGRNPSPTLYVERVGGSMVDFKAAMGRLPVAGDNTPTIWEHFPCRFDTQSSAFQCDVSRPQVRALTKQGLMPLYTDQNQVENADTFCGTPAKVCIVTGTCASWSALPLKTVVDGDLADEPSEGDHVDVRTVGWIRESHFASVDLSLVHKNMHTTIGQDICHDSLGVVITLVGCIIGFCDLGGAGADWACGGAADWILHIRPLALSMPDPNQAFLRVPTSSNSPAPPFWNLLASQADPRIEGVDGAPPLGDMEIEWEADWQNWWVSQNGNQLPPQGGLVFLNGRWVMDCGHPIDVASSRYKSEIHPPNTIIFSESSDRPTGMSPPPPGRDAIVTRAQVWVNELYEGKPFETTIWPPPRPEPFAELDAVLITFNQPPGSVVTAPDGSTVIPFVNQPVGFVFPDISLDRSAAVVALTKDGLHASVSGPPGTHRVDSLGQVLSPVDSMYFGDGTVGSLMGRWYVGWSTWTQN